VKQAEREDARPHGAALTAAADGPSQFLGRGTDLLASSFDPDERDRLFAAAAPSGAGQPVAVAARR